jgi:hypothetical protein
MRYKLLIFGLIFVLTFSFNGVFAQETDDVTASGERAGILPTSLFYFLKEIRRGIESVFTFNPVAKTRLELKFAAERATEIEVLKEKGEAVALKSIEKAIDNYQQNVERLRSRLESLGETSENPNVDRLLDELTARALRHQQLFDELKTGRTELEAKIEAAQETLTESFSVALERFDLPEKTEMRFERALKNIENPLKEIEALNVISKVERKITNEGMKNRLLKAEENLISKFEGRIEGGKISLPQLSELIKNLQKPEEKKLEILDSLRENVSSPTLKMQLNVMRQPLLNKVSAVSEEKTREEIEEALKAVNELQSAMAAAGAAVGTAVRQLAEQAKFNLEQAQRLFEAGDYGRALGQATSAKAVTRNGLRLLTGSSAEAAEKVNEFRREFDELKRRAREHGLNLENTPRLFKLFSQAESKIVESLNLVGREAVAERLNIILREIRTALSSIEVMIGEQKETKEAVESSVREVQTREAPTLRPEKQERKVEE